ncbi:MAG: NAD(P)-dependent oxidoreductase [Rhodospirillaceae bacterium]|jgi:3-hydroxyisobutyrate dehydrogenase|nr:NAD(P)-dependent oxidoreductase [Rhodospirillaceae bacterium]MBT5014117.1 NAD(P)-dependent oxidoreductase [Rhodospirillaceae bacterium]MBT7355615.1 NAD(P)-dependent oxidoreductase [Rhodospirillaceae bacterium]
MSKQKLAFIGLGVMGYPMAGHLAKAGHEVTVYNRTTAKAEAWAKEHGGNFADTPAKASAGADIIFACVGNDDDLRSVTFGDDGILAGMDEGAVFVDHTTASADVAREIYAAAKSQDKGFLDGPVSGGQAGAENAQLTIMLGGDKEKFDETAPVMEIYGKAVTLMGDAGAGQLTKMVNQICIAGLVQGLSEGLNFAEAAGLDAKLVVDVISKGAAQSWQMENRGYTMVKDEFEFGFAVDWMRKDLGICIAESKNNGAKLPVTETVAGFYDQVSEMGGGRWDTSSLLRLLKK